MASKAYCKVLTIAGSDCGGGAGIQADLKTFSAIGCYGMSVITALTAQNTMGVQAIHPIQSSFAEAQIQSIFDDMGVDAVKIGMLYSSELVERVAQQLKRYHPSNVVLDPVMVATSGDKLLQDDAIEAIKVHLMPLATVVTPNLPEAAVLLGLESSTKMDLTEAAKALSQFGSASILVKGGHLNEPLSTDVFYMVPENRVVILEGKRISTPHTHGTGCTLSSAIASYLAKGFALEQAVRNAKAYIEKAIEAGSLYQLGKGHGPVHHFFQYW